MCMYKLALNDELVQRTRMSFANETDMTAWLQRQVEALMIEYIILKTAGHYIVMSLTSVTASTHPFITTAGECVVRII